MKLVVEIDSASSEPAPEEGDLRSWIRAALSDRQRDTEISVRLVDIEEMSELNQRYRNKTGPTNVLSFPADIPAELNHPLLGDIVICAPVVRREAAEQGKPEESHWAHMTVHGTLHLLGYDHVVEAEAEAMEAMETAILATLNYPCPYSANATPLEHVAQ
ncbi:MAG: rRNA maturation RNase YbeY [Halioglobus sp.]